MTLVDLPRVLQIQAACYTAIVPESEASLRAKLLASPRTCFAAWCDERLVGYLLAVPVAWPGLPALDAPDCVVPQGADNLYVHDLALAPEARGSGAAGALVQAALAAGRALGLAQAVLVAIQDSQRYWQRQGFACETVVPASLAAKLASYGAQAVLMRQDLGGQRGVLRQSVAKATPRQGKPRGPATGPSLESVALR